MDRYHAHGYGADREYNLNPDFETLSLMGSTAPSETQLPRRKDLGPYGTAFDSESIFDHESVGPQDLELREYEQEVRRLKLRQKIAQEKINLRRMERELSCSSGYAGLTSEAGREADRGSSIRKSLGFQNIKQKISDYGIQTEKEVNKAVLILCRDKGKVPKFTSEKSVAHFIAYDLSDFIEQQGFTQVSHVLPWVANCFPGKQDRIKNRLDIILGDRAFGLDEFLKRLSDNLSETGVSVDITKLYRKESESLEDCFFRSLKNINLLNYSEEMKMGLLVQVLMEHEKDQRVQTELRRELYNPIGNYSVEGIKMAVMRCDKILGIGRLEGSKACTDEPLICAFQNQAGYRPRQQGTRKYRNCKECGKSHPERHPKTNTILELCYDCFHKKWTQAEYRDCRVCKKQHKSRCPQTGRLFEKCFECHISERQALEANRPIGGARSSARPNFGIRNFSEVVAEGNSISIEAPGARSFASAMLCEAETGNKRLRVKIESSNGLKETGLVDTGATHCVISFGVLEKHGLVGRMKKPEKPVFATAFDGSAVGILGMVKLPVKVGNETFDLEFDVVGKLNNFGVILGAPFLSKLGLMAEIEQALNKSNIITSLGN